jgi:hypothetical protein
MSRKSLSAKRAVVALKKSKLDALTARVYQEALFALEPEIRKRRRIHPASAGNSGSRTGSRSVDILRDEAEPSKGV